MSNEKSDPPRAKIHVFHSRPEYADKMEALQHLVYDTNREEVGDTILAEQFLQHLRIFPHGQYIAVDDAHDRVVGLTVSMRVQFDPRHPHNLIEPWRITTNNAWLTTHNPRGEWLYGVESAVHPAYRGYGIGRALMEARWHVARRLNLRGMVAGGTLKDYHKHAHRMSPEAYVRAVERGELFCTNLSKQFRMGFKPIAIIPNYVGDPDTLGYAAMIVWHNPDYHPERTPQRIYKRRYVVEMRNRPHHVAHAHGHGGHAGSAAASASV